MDLRHLRTFVTVAEQGTVSKASLRLRVAQPALSRQIKELEEELGLRLFDRVRQRLVLTGEGEQLLGDCRAIFGAVGSLSEHVQRLRRADTGILKVATTPQTLEGVFSAFLHRYAERRPNVQVKLIEAVGPSLLDKLERGDVHLSICLMQTLRTDDHPFDNHPLPPMEFFAASHSSLRLGTAGNIDITELAPYPLLLLDSSSVVRGTFNAACRLAGLKPNIFVESRSPQALLALAEAGHGVAIVPSVLPTNRHRLRVVRIMHRRRPLREPQAVFWDKRRALPLYARDFCEFLAAHMRQTPRKPRSSVDAGSQVSSPARRSIHRG